jgi:protein-S-isoprenylcysteine O-methyltransferase Ste14
MGEAVTNGQALPIEQASTGDRRRGWLMVFAQFCLLAVIVLLPAASTWTVPSSLNRIANVAAWLGIGLAFVAASALGRGLTATPLPNKHARLRTGGLYRFVRHPIYSGLLLFALARTLTSGNPWIASACAALVVLINIKARWEEGQLARRFPDYNCYRQRTARFIPQPTRNRRGRSPI